MAAAWVTRRYQRYKLVVVNAWVDVPDDEDAEAHEEVENDAEVVRRPSRNFNLDPGVFLCNERKDPCQGSFLGCRVKKRRLKANRRVEDGSRNGKKR